MDTRRMARPATMVRRLNKVTVTLTRRFVQATRWDDPYYEWEVMVTANIRGHHQLLEKHDRLDRLGAARILATWREFEEAFLEDVFPAGRAHRARKTEYDWRGFALDAEEAARYRLKPEYARY